MTHLPPDPMHPTMADAGTDEPHLIPRETRTLVMLCHLLGLSGYAIPFGHIIGPMVLWLIKKDECVDVDIAGRESLNFAISITIWGVIGVVLAFAGIGFCILFVMPVLHAVPIIIATVRANDGRHWRYPMTIRML